MKIEIPNYLIKKLGNIAREIAQVGYDAARDELAASLTGAKSKRGRKTSDAAKPRKPRADAGKPRGPRKPKANAQPSIPWDGRGDRPKAPRKPKTILSANAAQAGGVGKVIE